MIQHIEINGKPYPFKFGMREVYMFTGDGAVDEVNEGVTLSFDALLRIYHSASKGGAKKEGSDLVLSEEEIEDAIDEDPYLLDKFEQVFIKSKVIPYLEEKAAKMNGDGSKNVKKPRKKS